MTQVPTAVAVLGLGSVLTGDDGIGPHAVHRLESRFSFPSEVRLLDLGTPGPGLVEILVGLEAAIAIDSVHTNAEPGEVVLYRRDQLIASAAEDRPSVHQPLLKKALRAADLHGGGPQEVLLIGVVPHSVEPSTELSRRVRRALPRIELEVMKELLRLGHPALPLDREVDPTSWLPKAGTGTPFRSTPSK